MGVDRLKGVLMDGRMDGWMERWRGGRLGESRREGLGWGGGVYVGRDSDTWLTIIMSMEDSMEALKQEK